MAAVTDQGLIDFVPHTATGNFSLNKSLPILLFEYIVSEQAKQVFLLRKVNKTGRIILDITLKR